MNRFTALALVLSAIIVVGPAGEAHACSCALLDPMEMLDGADAAFVGTLVERPTEPIAADEFEGIWVFEVEEWVKGDLGPQVGVHAALDGAGCGFELQEGDRAGILLYNANGRPSGGLCSTTTADALLAANQPLVFDGTGPPVFLVTAPSGRARLATLDASGRLLKAVKGDQPIWSVSVCPGGDWLVEATEGTISVRDTTSLELVREVTVGKGRVEQVWCLDPEAEELLGHVWHEETQQLDLRRLPSGKLLGPAGESNVAVGPDRIAIFSHTGNVEVVALPDGSTTQIRTSGEPSAVAFSPSGRLLVAETTYPPDGGYHTRARVFDASGNLEWESEPLADTSVMNWYDDERLAATVYPVDAELPRELLLEVGTGDMAEVEVPGWEFFTVEGGVVSSEEGALYLTLDGDPPAEIGTLPSPNHRLISILDPQADIQATPLATPPEPGPEPASPPPPSGNETGPVTVALVVTAAAGMTLAGIVAFRRRRRTTLPGVD